MEDDLKQEKAEKIETDYKIQRAITEYTALTSRIADEVRWVRNLYYTFAFAVIVISGYTANYINNNRCIINDWIPFFASLISEYLLIVTFYIHYKILLDVNIIGGYFCVFKDSNPDFQYGYYFLAKIFNFKPNDQLKTKAKKILKNKKQLFTTTETLIFGLLSFITLLPIGYYWMENENFPCKFWIIIVILLAILIYMYFKGLKIRRHEIEVYIKWREIRNTIKDLVKEHSASMEV